MVRITESGTIPNLDAEKARRAAAFYREMDERASENAKSPDYVTNGHRLHAVAGIFQPTLQSATLVSGKVVFSTQYPGKDFDGDGTVPRNSAKPRGFAKDALSVACQQG
jgi:hypothetical protein